MYPSLCGSGWALCIPCSPTGCPYPPNGPGGTGRVSGVSAAVWEWLGPVHTLFPHGASLSPKRPRQGRRDSGVSGPVCGDGNGNAHVLPRGAPIPQAPQAGPEGLRCIRRCVGVAGPCAYLVSSRIVSIPETLRPC